METFTYFPEGSSFNFLTDVPGFKEPTIVSLFGLVDKSADVEILVSCPKQIVILKNNIPYFLN